MLTLMFALTTTRFSAQIDAPIPRLMPTTPAITPPTTDGSSSILYQSTRVVFCYIQVK